MAEARWKSLRGPRRIQAEFKLLDRAIKSGKLAFIKDLTLVGDDVLCWRFGLHNFDSDLEGGRNLNSDLAELKRRFGQDHLLMEIQFPHDYPHQPFFIRVVSPRCQMYTGHVTAGGSICLEALTLSGTPGSWQPELCVEALLNVVMVNMIDCPVTYVQTATGPGGRSGPLRIDFSCHNPCAGYSNMEAKAAFQRTLDNHKRMGWGGGAAAGGGAAGGSAGGPAAAAAAGGAGGLRARLKSSFNAAASAGPAYAAAVAAAKHGAAAAGLAARSRRSLRASAAAAAASASDDDASEGYAAVAAAAAGGGGAKRAAPQAAGPRKRQAAAAAAGGGSRPWGPTARSSRTPEAPPVIALLSDSEDEEEQQQRKKQWKKPQQQQQQRLPGVQAPAAVVCIDDSDDDSPAAGQGSREGSCSPVVANNINNNTTDPLATAAAAFKRLPARSLAALSPADAGKQQRQQWAAPPGVFVIGSQPDVKDEDDAVMIVGTAPARRQRRQQAAAAAAAGDDVIMMGVIAPPPPPRPVGLQLELAYPDYWDFSTPMTNDSVRLVDLPLPAGGPPLSPLQAAAQAAAINPHVAASLQEQGLSHDDALAALLLAEGDADEALLRAATYAEWGGAARAWADMQGPAAQRGRQQVSALQEEAGRVLGMFEEGGLPQDRVVRIQRLQHSRLWRRFCVFKQELEELRGPAGVNEEMLFHGSTAAFIDTITETGFDFRLVNYSSAYGNGAYFADHSTTALAYSTRPAAANGAMMFAGLPPSLPPFMAALPQPPATRGGGSKKRSAWALRQQQQQQQASAAAAAAAARDPCPPGCVKMLLARVMLGTQGLGQPGMRKPPPGCDSVNSGGTPVPPMPGMLTVAAGGGRGAQARGVAGSFFSRQRRYYCHVIFDNNQAYPEYVITCRAS